MLAEKAKYSNDYISMSFNPVKRGKMAVCMLMYEGRGNQTASGPKLDFKYKQGFMIVVVGRDDFCVSFHGLNP